MQGGEAAQPRGPALEGSGWREGRAGGPGLAGKGGPEADGGGTRDSLFSAAAAGKGRPARRGVVGVASRVRSVPAAWSPGRGAGASKLGAGAGLAPARVVGTEGRRLEGWSRAGEAGGRRRGAKSVERLSRSPSPPFRWRSGRPVGRLSVGLPGAARTVGFAPGRGGRGWGGEGSRRAGSGDCSPSGCRAQAVQRKNRLSFLGRGSQLPPLPPASDEKLRTCCEILILFYL